MAKEVHIANLGVSLPLVLIELMVSDSSAPLRLSMQQVSRVLAYTQGARELRLALPYPSPQSHGVDPPIAVQGRVSGGFIVTKLKNLGSTVHLPPKEYIDIDDTHATGRVRVSIHTSIIEPRKD